MRDRKKRNIIIGALCCLLVFMGIGYAILSQTLNISGIANMKGNWNVKITNMELLSENKTGRAEEVSHSFTDTTATFEADLYMPGDSIEYRVTVENQGNIDAVLNDIIQTKTNKDKNLKFSNSLIGTEVLTSGSKMSFTMKAEIPEDAEALPEVKVSKYEIKLIYIQYNGGEYTPPAQSIGTLADKVLADNTALPDTNIDFSKKSSDTNGKGLYYTNKNTENNKKTYYFRGNVTNNYVRFATQTRNTCTYNGKSVAYYTEGGLEYNPTETQCLSTNVCVAPSYGTIVGVDENTQKTCSSLKGTLASSKATFKLNSTEDIEWRIVRINEDGSVRLVTENPVGSSVYNPSERDNAYAGYMYGTAGSSTYEETHQNVNNSIIKTYLDNWYNANLNIFSSYFSMDAGFCNDRSIASSGKWDMDDTALGYAKNLTFYGAYNRLSNLKQPQFKCPQTNDLFTTTTSQKGNKSLTYPIGLLTADELMYSGASTQEQGDYYLNNNNTIFWTMSPYATYGKFAGSSNMLGIVFYNGFSNVGVRPVVNISSVVEITNGDGTKDNPYVIK